MSFDEACRYLLSLGHETLALKLGLERIAQLLDAVGRPHDSFPSVQIAGTNGKGSTAAMLDRMCRAAGIRTGLYTSPHLISITERICVDGSEISHNDFARITTRVRDAALALQGVTGTLPTFFEQVTAIALCAYMEAGVELAILETGLGGRLDATTAANASIAVITPIAFDHQAHLGETLAEIAHEKAAIIRERITTHAVIAPQSPEVLSVITLRAQACGIVPHLIVESGVSVHEHYDDGHLSATFRTRQDVYENVRVNLRGRHQLVNALVAIEAAEVLRERNFRIPRAAIIKGIEHAEHNGRLELRRTRRGARLLFDGAHNTAGAGALRAYLEEFASGTPVTIIFGAMRDKDLAQIAQILFPLATHHLILTQIANSRAATPEMLARASPSGFDSSRITLAASVDDALETATRNAEPDEIICVTGSLFLVGEALKAVISAE